MNSRYLIIVVGSLGDLLPMLTIAQRLKALGHEVTVTAPSRYAALCASCEIPFFELPISDQAFGDREKDILAHRYRDLWLLRYAVPLNNNLYTLLRREADANLMILAVNRLNLWADAYAFCYLGTPVVRFDIDPPMSQDVTNLPDTRVTRTLFMKWQVAWSRLLHAQGLNARSNSVTRLIRRLESSIPVVPLYPPWLVGRPASENNGSFIPPPSYGGADGTTDWVFDTNRPTILFVAGTDGTLSGWNSRFFEASIAICRILDCNGCLLGGISPFENTNGCEHVRWKSFAPLSDVLGRCDAVVHHGGIGTAAAAIRAGVPQLVLPRVFAQPSNSAWLGHLGVAQVMDPSTFTAASGASAINRLLNDNECRRRAALLADKCYDESYVDALCGSLVSIMSPRLTVPSHIAVTGLNNESSPREMSIYLFCGIPAVGKSTFAKWLADNHGFTHLDVEKPFAMLRLGLLRHWHKMFGLDWNPSRFVAQVKELGTQVVIDWPCLPRCISIVKAMQETGIRVWWFGGDPSMARQSFADRGVGLLADFDRQMCFIDSMRKEIVEIVGGRSVDILDAYGKRMPAAEIYAAIGNYEAKSDPHAYSLY